MVELAREVLLRDDEIDSLNRETFKRLISAMADHPDQADRALCLTNISKHLERVGDHAVNIAKAARRLSDTQPLPEIRELSEMVQITREMLADALAAYVTRNTGTARMVCVTDDKVDHAIALLQDVCGNLADPATGIAFVIPVSRVVGLAPELGDEGDLA